MNTEAPLTIELSEVDLAEVRGGNTNEEINEFIRNFQRYLEQQQMGSGEPIW